MDLDLKTQRFRELLQQELAKRCKSNPSYSARAFARTLGIESSWLSKMMRGKRRITSKLIQKVGSRLNLSPEQIAYFQGATQLPSQNYFELDQTAFEAISEWYHFAILELMKTRSFKPDCRWIAKRLRVSVPEITLAVERLERVRILKRGKKWIDDSGGSTRHDLNPLDTSAAKRLLQQDLLEQSSLSLKEIDIADRDHSSMILSFPRNRMAEAKKLIDDFRYQFNAQMHSRATDDVYALLVSLFPLTQIETSKTKRSTS